MFVAQNSIQAFIDVIELKSALFSTQDWIELVQMANNLPSDEEQITEKIENWLKPEYRRPVLQAYKELLEKAIVASKIDLNANIGAGNTQSSTPPNQPSDSAKELLENAIKNNSPLSDSPPTQPKQP